MPIVLADRHHAGLWRSLQLLGDRLGWTLYTPVGIEWWRTGIWNFGRSTWGDDRLAQQFLNGDGWEDRDHHGLYRAYDPEYPDVAEGVIWGLGLQRARTMRWDYVIATAEDNQWGFADFAKGVGARFVMQVGNTRQTVDWKLDPLAIVSSEVPIEGRGVRYHQEMDPAYSWHDPSEADRWSVRSFVNLMPRIECAPLMAEAQGLGTDFRWGVHGIDCPDGVVKPSSDLAALMAASGFGWHDKITGDGFGHVIHGWAAIGRPLIGHASHYKGQLGEHLWQDGKTCIDLDRHPITEAMQMVRAIADDPEWHGAMCRAIRAEFDTIDHAAEAEAIRALLTG